MNVQIEDWMSVPDAAKELGMTPVQVGNHIRYHRTLRSIKIATARLVHRDDVAKLKAKREAEAAQVTEVAA